MYSRKVFLDADSICWCIATYSKNNDKKKKICAVGLLKQILENGDPDLEIWVLNVDLKLDESLQKVLRNFKSTFANFLTF